MVLYTKKCDSIHSTHFHTCGRVKVLTAVGHKTNKRLRRPNVAALPRVQLMLKFQESSQTEISLWIYEPSPLKKK